MQGNTNTSPLAGQTVTVRGVVTLDAQAGLNGFFLLDATPDSVHGTSDGVFVYTSSAPKTLSSAASNGLSFWRRPTTADTPDGVASGRN